MREVEVECLPLEIPEAIEVDVTALEIHDVIHISSMIFASNVRPIFDTDYPVVTVLPPTVTEAPVAAAAAAEGAAAPAEGSRRDAGRRSRAEGGKEAAAPAGWRQEGLILNGTDRRSALRRPTPRGEQAVEKA